MSETPTASNRRALGVMADIPVLQIQRGEGGDWSVAATWPNGCFEEIGGFKNESDANEWVAKEFQAWLDDHEKKTSSA